MCLLVEYGVKFDILIDVYLYIGFNKFFKIVGNICFIIEYYGGQVYFDSNVIDFFIEDGVIKGVIVNNNLEYIVEVVILVIGYFVWDIYYLFY